MLNHSEDTECEILHFRNYCCLCSAGWPSLVQCNILLGVSVIQRLHCNFLLHWRADFHHFPVFLPQMGEAFHPEMSSRCRRQQRL